jgi:hypothetical protein
MGERDGDHHDDKADNEECVPRAMRLSNPMGKVSVVT